MKKQTTIFLGLLLFLLLTVSFFFDLSDTAKGGSIDLRNRVTGARVFQHGQDPYLYKWTIAEPPEYCDPYNQPGEPVSKVTVTPTVLFLHLSFASLPYDLIQFLWLFIQWGSVLGILWLAGNYSSRPSQFWLIAFFIAGFTYTAAWRLHAERGQIYVLFLFLFILWMVLSKMSKYDFWAGFIAGILAAIRLPFLLLAPFLFLHGRTQFKGMLAGFLFMALLPCVVSPSVWNQYFAAMGKHGSIYFSETKPTPLSQNYPEYVEGIHIDKLAHLGSIPFADNSIYYFLKHVGFPQSSPMVCILMLAAVFGAWVWLSRGVPLPSLLLPMSAFLFIADFFLPAYRNNYNDIFIVAVLLCGLADQAYAGKMRWICHAALVMGWGIYFIQSNWCDWKINIPTVMFFAASFTVVLFQMASFFNRGEQRL